MRQRLDHFLDLFRFAVTYIRQQLYEITARSFDSTVRSDEHPDPNCCRHLLAAGKVMRQVLTYFAGHDRDSARVRLLHAKVARDGEKSIRAHSTANIQLSVQHLLDFRLRVVDEA